VLPTLRDALRPLFAGRKMVLAGGPLAAMTGTCRRLRELGAERPFLLATGTGTGELPEIAGRRVYGPRRPE
jgi:hypothetical protein